MVSAADVKYKKSIKDTIGLGSVKSSNVIVSATPLNLFDTVTATQSISGLTEYRCFYAENSHLTEKMESCDIYLQSDNPNSAWSTIQWGLEPYRYAPYMVFDGVDDFVEEPDATELQITKFTISCWFKTPNGFSTNAFLVNKGGAGSESAGENDNYSLKFNSSEQIVFGFEEGNGTDHYITSPSTYNDNRWHLAVGTYDGTIMELFIDDMTVSVAQASTTAIPETNTKPLRIGKNSRASDSFYFGNLDEVRVWNRGLTQDERLNLYNWGIVPSNGLVYENKFDTNTTYGTFDGIDDFVEQAHSASLNLNNFTMSAWFRTSKDYTIDVIDGTIISKGGVGDETPGMNQNYGIRVFKDTNMIRAGFETSAGEDHEPSSDPITVNDGIWHHVVCTNDGAVVRLYLDGFQVKQHSHSATPENNTNPLRIGKNSFDDTRYFQGNIDDVIVWNDDITAAEVLSLYEDAIIPQTANIVYKNEFGAGSNYATVAQRITNETTSPLGINWLGVTNGPVTNTPNIGTLLALHHIPIWVKWVVAANSPDAKDDYCVFALQGKIPEGGTGGGDPGDPVPPPEPTGFSFVATGDWGCESMTDDIVDLIVELDPELVIGVGDNNYDDDGTIGCFIDAIEPIDDNQGSDIRFETAFGNHDNAESAEDSTESGLKNHFGYNNTYYSFDVENVHFLCLDNTTETSFGSGSSQHTFANNDLLAARNNPNIDWIVVYVHKPMFGASSDHGYNSGNFNQAYGPMFNTHKVDLICTGHNHNLQMTELVLYNSSSPTSPTPIETGSPYAGGTGFIHVVTGTGGHDSGGDLYSLGSQPGFQEWQNDSDNAVLHCTLSNSNKTMTCSFVDVSGEILHTIVINR